MAPQYKLTYFDLKGLGEPIRYILAYGNVEYTDNRINRDDWPKLKPSVSFGKLPLLEFDGNTLSQHATICRYLAKQFNLTGKTDLDAAKADLIVDTLGDLRSHFREYRQEEDETKKAQKLDDVLKTHAPFYLGKLDSIVAENGGNFVKGQLTWADLYFAATADVLTEVAPKGSFDSFKNLTALREKVAEIPQIKKWIEVRP